MINIVTGQKNNRRQKEMTIFFINQRNQIEEKLDCSFRAKHDKNIIFINLYTVRWTLPIITYFSH